MAEVAVSKNARNWLVVALCSALGNEWSVLTYCVIFKSMIWGWTKKIITRAVFKPTTGLKSVGVQGKSVNRRFLKKDVSKEGAIRWSLYMYTVRVNLLPHRRSLPTELSSPILAVFLYYGVVYNVFCKVTKNINQNMPMDFVKSE